MVEPKVLRAFVCLELLCHVLAGVSDYIVCVSLSEPLGSYEAVRIRHDGPIIGIIGTSVALAMLAASLGAGTFARGARHFYLATRVAAIALLPLLSPSVVNAWAEPMEATAYSISGIVIALMYWSPLRSLYDRPEVQEAI